MVVTKDLSRLGRNYVQSGLYIETYFPEHEVRFVAILDNIDTAYDTSNNDIAPFKSILNEMYAKDTSKKINSVLQSKRNLGEYLGTAPYGYKKDPENKYHLIIDEEAANVVKLIYEKYLAGFGTMQIADYLSKKKIPIPSDYNKRKRGTKSLTYGLWQQSTVRFILSNEIYTGTVIQGKRKKVTGTVKDANGEPIIGATVVEKGTTKGVASDIKGKYSFKNVKQGATLVFSFIGMQTQEIPVGKGNMLKNGTSIAVLTIGTIGNTAARAIEEAEKECNASIAHYDMIFLKPLDDELLTEIGNKFDRILTVEDGALNGGFGSAVADWMCDHGFSPKIERAGIPDRFIRQGTVAQLDAICGIDKESIKDRILKLTK